MSEKNSSVILVGSLLFLFIVFLSIGTGLEKPEDSKLQITNHKEFPQITLEAKSAYVYDLRSGETLFEKEADRRLPLASVTKLMSALVASSLSPGYSRVRVTSTALSTQGDSGLKPGEEWSLRELLDYSLLTSSNDGIRAVALSLASLEREASDREIIESFVLAMNEKASELNLKNTYFWNETGLDESEVKGGAYGSARDVAQLLGYIVISKPDILSATREDETTLLSLDRESHRAKNTNVLVNEIPGVLASKTGFTDIAGGNLVFAFDPELGRPIVVVVLGSSAQGRFADARELIKATMEYIQK